MESAVEGAPSTATKEPEADEESPRPTTKESQQIEQLFAEARKDRSRAYELKQELDRMGLFGEFEDRFLDLFKEP